MKLTKNTAQQKVTITTFDIGINNTIAIIINNAVLIKSYTTDTFYIQ